MKQMAPNKDKVSQYFNELGRNKQIIFADSGDWTVTDSEYLPGGIMNILRNNIVVSFDSTKTKIDKLGK